MLSRHSALVAAILCFSSAAQAQVDADRPNTLVPHRTGAFKAMLSERSPESEAGRWSERLQFGGNLRNWDYDLATESFSVYVPPDYDPQGDAYGALIWLSPLADGAIPESFQDVLDERHLIWIGPNNAGNDRHIFVRSGMALDAALNIQRAYHVDPSRVFVSGLSGGGRVAAMQAVDYPDVFSGGFPIIGVTTYLDVPLESSPGQAVLRFLPPAPALLQRAMGQPFVIMTGSGDFNREECRLVANAYRRAGFSDVHLLDVEGMGHQMPTPEDFARGLDLLLAEATTTR
jgi:predicted esterase